MSKHLKRLAAPRSWAIPRKTNVYTTKPRPGAHPIERALPLATVIRDMLKLTETGREARRIIGAGEVHVDGRVVKEPKFAVGFMDVVSVAKLGKAWRVIVDEKARLRLAPSTPSRPAGNSARLLARPPSPAAHPAQLPRRPQPPRQEGRLQDRRRAANRAADAEDPRPLPA